MLPTPMSYGQDKQVCCGVPRGLWGCSVFCQGQVVVSQWQSECTGGLPACWLQGSLISSMGTPYWYWGGSGMWGPCRGTWERERSCGCDSLTWEEMGASVLGCRAGWGSVSVCLHRDVCASQEQADGPVRLRSTGEQCFPFNSLLIADTAAEPVVSGLFLHGWRGVGALLGHVSHRVCCHTCVSHPTWGLVTLHPFTGDCPGSVVCKHPRGAPLAGSRRHHQSQG